MIKIEHVNKTFTTKSGEVPALQDVSLEVEAGDIYGVIGYSGAGKSTLLRMVNLLERPENGAIYINNQNIIDLKERELNILRKDIGMIFQQFNLLESQTVYQNIAIPLILSKLDKKAIEVRVKQLLSFVELEDKRDTYVSQLSGSGNREAGRSAGSHGLLPGRWRTVRAAAEKMLRKRPDSGARWSQWLRPSSAAVSADHQR